MFAIPFTASQVYSHLGLYQQPIEKLDPLTKVQYESAEKLRDIITQLSRRSGGISLRKNLIRDIAFGNKPKLNIPSLTHQVRHNREFKHGRGRFILVDSSGSDYYDGIFDDMDLILRSNFVLPHVPGLISEQLRLIVIDNDFYLKHIPSEIAILRDVLSEHMVKVSIDGVSLDDPYISKFFRRPFILYDHTKFRKVDLTKVVLINKTGKSKAQLIDKYKLNDDAVFINYEIFDVMLQPVKRRDGDIEQFVRMRGDVEAWKLKIGTTFESNLLELFIHGVPVMNSTSQLQLDFQISDIRSASVFDEQIVCAAKLNGLREQCLKESSLIRVNIIGQKGSGKSMLMRLINERGIPGISRKIICIDSDAYGKWKTQTQYLDDKFSALKLINVDNLHEISQDDNIVSYYEQFIIDQLLAHNITISEHTNSIRFIKQLRVDTLKDIGRKFKELYLADFKEQVHFYEYLCGNIPEPSNTLLITFLHATVETSAAPGTNMNFSLNTILYPLQTILNRKRGTLVNFILNRIYDEMGTEAFTRLRPCDVWK